MRLFDSTSDAALTEFLSSDELCWREINSRIDSDEGWREYILWRIHFKRAKKLKGRPVKRLVRFMFRAYRSTADIRFFNEYLYLTQKQFRNSIAARGFRQLFSQYTLSDGTHRWPINRPRPDAALFLSPKNAASASSPVTLSRIGLLGSPHFFGGLKKKLGDAGFNVEIFFIPYHSNKLVNFLYNSTLLFQIFRVITGSTGPYSRIDLDHKSDLLTSVIRSHNIDIAFHKLGFILKRNLIDSIPQGIINDHWGPLPEIKGRSSPEFTLLHGLPMVVTTHFIAEEVDNGAVISYFDCRAMKESSRSMRELKAKIKRRTDERVIRSIALVESGGHRDFDAGSRDGLMYYEMHPSLIRYIDRVILQKKRFSIF